MKFKKIISYAVFFNLSLGMGLFASSAHAQIDVVDEALEGRIGQECETVTNATSRENVSQACLDLLAGCEAKFRENLLNISREVNRSIREQIIPGELVQADPQDLLNAIRERLEDQINRALEKYREDVVRDCQPLPPPPPPVNPPVVEDVDQIVADQDVNAAEGGCSLNLGAVGSVNYLYLLGMLLPLLGLRRK